MIPKAFLGKTTMDIDGMIVRNLWIKTSWETVIHSELITEGKVIPLKNKTVYQYKLSGGGINIIPGIQLGNDRYNMFDLVDSMEDLEERDKE